MYLNFFNFHINESLTQFTAIKSRSLSDVITERIIITFVHFVLLFCEYDTL